MAKIIKLVPKKPAQPAPAPAAPEQSLTDQRIDAMFHCLPATTTRQIAERLVKRLKNPNINASTVVGLLVILRANKDGRYNWTVPAVRTGIPSSRDKNRYFAITFDVADGLTTFDDVNRQHLYRGSRSTVLRASTQLKNQSKAIRFALQYEQSPAAQKLMRNLMRKFSFLSDEAAEVAEHIEDKGLNGTA